MRIGLYAHFYDFRCPICDSLQPPEKVKELALLFSGLGANSPYGISDPKRLACRSCSGLLRLVTKPSAPSRSREEFSLVIKIGIIWFGVFLIVVFGTHISLRALDFASDRILLIGMGLASILPLIFGLQLTRILFYNNTKKHYVLEIAP